VDENGNARLERPHPSKKGHNAFGWGRRQCSGQPYAEQGLFITLARMLWAFNIRPGLDAQVKIALHPCIRTVYKTDI